MPEHSNLILIRGAPGAGKTTLSGKLRSRFPKGIIIEIDSIRGMIIGVEWINSDQHAHALEAAAGVVKAYIKNGYSPVIVIDTFGPSKLRKFISLIGDSDSKITYCIVSLFCEEKQLVARITGRKKGFSEIEPSLILNREVGTYRHPRETMIDTSLMTPDEVAEKVMEILC